MGERFPAITYREVAGVLKQLGFKFYRQGKGSHEIWRRLSDGRHTTVPHHKGKIIKRRTLKTIINDTGLSVEEFKKLLRG